MKNFAAHKKNPEVKKLAYLKKAGFPSLNFDKKDFCLLCNLQ